MYEADCVPISSLRLEEADDLLARDCVKRLTQIQRKGDSTNKIWDISPLLQRMPARRGSLEQGASFSQVSNQGIRKSSPGGKRTAGCPSDWS